MISELSVGLSKSSKSSKYNLDVLRFIIDMSNI